jgi:Icc-related predicted phosphoesterase
MTLNEILAIQKVLTNRNLPSDILDYAEQQRVSESTGKMQVIGECDIVHVLRILLKENRNAKNKSNKSSRKGFVPITSTKASRVAT